MSDNPNQDDRPDETPPEPKVTPPGRIPEDATGPIERAQATLDALNKTPKIEIVVPYSKNGPDPHPDDIPASAEVVTLAMINGVRFTCQRGKRRKVPLEVAYIACQSGVIRMSPEPKGYADWKRSRVVGQPLPQLKGAPHGTGALGAATLDA